MISKRLLMEKPQGMIIERNNREGYNESGCTTGRTL